MMERSDNVIARAIVVIAAAAVLNFLVVGYYSKATKDIFERTHRPYVGVVSIFLTQGGPAEGATLHVTYKNFGDVPALITDARWQVFVNSIKVPLKADVSNRSVLFSGIRGDMSGSLTTDAMKDIRARKPFEVEVWLRYEGLRRVSYDTYQKSRLNNFTKVFDVIGGDFK
jgi:hypothetical protein